ncbi:hypothetical protein [Tunturiibacter gelidiferens]|uniref:hypothetical protein n=1 Tax=Tunturiibacter gelidiferens TaxID=3069689 RepID=UPI003D9B202B
MKALPLSRHHRQPEWWPLARNRWSGRLSLRFGLWPSGDGSRIYVGLENGDGVAAIDTLTNKVIATIPTGQAPQALTYASDAVPSGPERRTWNRSASQASRTSFARRFR